LAAQLALLFPGQASQAVGMGVDLRQASPRAREVFELAETITGLPIIRVTEHGPETELTATEVAQPALLATSLAALAVLNERTAGDWKPLAVAGHSVGELAACVAAGALQPDEAIRLVNARAQSMAAACQAVDGTMLAVLGLEAEPLRAICEAASGPDGSVEVANLNAPGQLVISGERRAVERAAEQARAAGARRVVPLKVGGPFHSVYMRSAVEQMKAALRATPPRGADVPLVANVSAEPIQSAQDLTTELATQVCSPVRWTDSLHRLQALGCDRFLEVGPGSVLAGLVKRTLPSAKVASFGQTGDLEAAAALLGDGAE
jgi:[acyl-carrier-protein] S-malonyltransferase